MGDNREVHIVVDIQNGPNESDVTRVFIMGPTPRHFNHFYSAFMAARRAGKVLVQSVDFDGRVGRPDQRAIDEIPLVLEPIEIKAEAWRNDSQKTTKADWRRRMKGKR
jgi:hypothetical protein